MKGTIEMLTELVNAAKECRTKQEYYFRNRHDTGYRNLLIQAKQAETRLDEKIYRVEQALKILPKPGVQASLNI